MSWNWPRSPPVEERPSFQALLGQRAGACCHDPQTRPDFRRTPQRCTPLGHSLRLFLQRPRWKSWHRAAPSRRLWTTEPARPAKSDCCDPAAEDGAGAPPPPPTTGPGRAPAIQSASRSRCTAWITDPSDVPTAVRADHCPRSSTSKCCNTLRRFESAVR